jgi:hypothetical protein
VSEQLKEQAIGSSDTAPAQAEPAQPKVVAGAKDSVKQTVAKGGVPPTGAKDTAPTGAKDGTLGAKD